MSFLVGEEPSKGGCHHDGRLPMDDGEPRCEASLAASEEDIEHSAHEAREAALHLAYDSRPNHAKMKPRAGALQRVLRPIGEGPIHRLRGPAWVRPQRVAGANLVDVQDQPQRLNASPTVDRERAELRALRC